MLIHQTYGTIPIRLVTIYFDRDRDKISADERYEVHYRKEYTFENHYKVSNTSKALESRNLISRIVFGITMLYHKSHKSLTWRHAREPE